MLKKLKILSIGYTRELWKQSDTQARMLGYAQFIDEYHVVTHSAHSNQLETPLKFAPNFWAYATNARSRFVSLIKLIQLGMTVGKNGLHLVQAQDPHFTGIAAYVVSRWFRVPLNVCVYGSNPFDSNWQSESTINRMTAFIGQRVLSVAEGVQVDGKATAISLEENGIPAEKIQQKPMIPFNIDDFFESKPSEDLRCELTENERFEHLALFVGRIVPQKNLKLLIDVCARLNARGRSVRFILVGPNNGSEKEKIETYIHAHHMNDHFLWLGRQPHERIPTFMATCDLFVLPSLYEGFARVLMECAAAGLPVVTTAVSGSEEAVIHGHSGFIVPIGDVEQFSEKIECVLDKPDMANKGQRMMRDVSERFRHPACQIEIWNRIVES